MKVSSIGKIATLCLAVATTGVFAAQDTADYMEYNLGDSIYRIPASQANNIDEIITLIESRNDVSDYGVVTLKADIPNAELSTSDFSIQAGGSLRLYSTFNAGYLNDFDAVLSYTCPSNMFIKSISSYHDNKREDRRFNIECGKYTTSGGARLYRKTVSWTGYVNSYDQAFNYTCPAGKFLVGVYSVHSNRHEDRVFKFACAAMAESSANGFALSAETCSNVGPTNFDQPWHLGSNGAIVGMASRHSNSHEDRETSVSFCTSVSDW
ncbi:MULTISPECIES: dermatopontin-like protein [unclassified Pseudoalteromonas]|uniref:dermatopontin-like protein n=1 Tax=unclassified Pseudoalteromonas TaxID=194690 RepID=UPI002096D9DF|nr:dermatopontin-like protein [Pseudoalteromonas sp. XMcav2-N]MCO7190566.1 dermatopontin-like protein [Pseudoalteromonas sp. XMcav2-N]